MSALGDPDTHPHADLEQVSPASPGSPSASKSKDDKQKKTKRPPRQLTEQQLAKKRQNDREAQRAIRERTRQTIESLENRVRELESGEAFTEMQSVMQERDEYRRERDELRDRITQMVQLGYSAPGESCSQPLTCLCADLSQEWLPISASACLRYGRGLKMFSPMDLYKLRTILPSLVEQSRSLICLPRNVESVKPFHRCLFPHRRICDSRQA